MGLAGERVSHPSISLWRFLAKEERSPGGWDLSPSKAMIGLGHHHLRALQVPG